MTPVHQGPCPCLCSCCLLPAATPGPGASTSLQACPLHRCCCCCMQVSPSLFLSLQASLAEHVFQLLHGALHCRDPPLHNAQCLCGGAPRQQSKWSPQARLLQVRTGTGGYVHLATKQARLALKRGSDCLSQVGLLAEAGMHQLPFQAPQVLSRLSLLPPF